MNPAIALIATYIVITAILQLVGFVVSWIVGLVDPTLSLMTFVILFIGMFWLAWPIAVRLSGAVYPDVKVDPAAKA
jgi:hypothetical protein